MTDALAVINDKAAELSDQMPEIERALSYRLSDAIREGASHTQPMLNGFVGPNGEMCALSAALLAVKARHMI